jgi:hypothetical protein
LTHGGPRRGAGRKKGALTKRTQEITQAALAEGLTPLEHMLKVLRDTNADEKRRDAMAVAAAQYVHPKLAAVEHSGSMAIAHEDAIDAIEADANGVDPLARAN